MRPGPRTLEYAKDKLHQRTRFAAAGMPVPEYAPVADAASIERFAARLGWPVVAKAQRGGYDGRGVWVLSDAASARDLVEECASRGVSLLVEEFVPIVNELAVLVARRPSGERVTYPVVETVQRDGICHEVLAPAPISEAVTEEARRIGEGIAELAEATGIIATELFWTQDGRVLVNEVATRPHNSGHFSIDGAATSQFENHLRAVLDWPLGPTDLRAPSVVMANLLGVDSASLAPRLTETLRDEPHVYPYLYGKGVRPGRKIGHVNALGLDPVETRERAVRAADRLTGRLIPGGAAQ